MALLHLADTNEPPVASLAEWLVNAIAPAGYGTAWTYDHLRGILHEDPRSTRGRFAIQRAKRRLLREHRKLLVNVRGEGYRLVQPADHAGEAARLNGLADRRRRHAIDVLIHVADDQLTPAERTHNEDQLRTYQILLAVSKTVHRAQLRGKVRSDGEDAVTMPVGRDLARLLMPAPHDES